MPKPQQTVKHARWNGCECDRQFQPGGNTCIREECQKAIFDPGGVLPCSLDYVAMGMVEIAHNSSDKTKRCADCNKPIYKSSTYCASCSTKNSWLKRKGKKHENIAVVGLHSG